MLRAIERVLGEGMLSREGHDLGVVGYELTLYQEWTDAPTGLVGGAFDVAGMLIGTNLPFASWTGTSAPLRLAMDDGRWVSLYVINADGVIAAADTRGFVSADV